MSPTCSAATARRTSKSLARSCAVTALLPRHRLDRLAPALRPGSPGSTVAREPSQPILSGDRVADELFDCSAAERDLRFHRVVKAVEQVARVLRVERRTQLR